MKKVIDVRKQMGETKTITVSKYGRGKSLKMVIEQTPYRINGKNQIVSRTRHVPA